jgi:hypothetical protein
MFCFLDLVALKDCYMIFTGCTKLVMINPQLLLPLQYLLILSGC